MTSVKETEERNVHATKMKLKTLSKKGKIKTSRTFTKMEKNMLSKDKYEGGKEGNEKEERKVFDNGNGMQILVA